MGRQRKQPAPAVEVVETPAVPLEGETSLVALLQGDMKAELPHDVAARLGGLVQVAQEFKARLEACTADLSPDAAALAWDITGKL